MKKDLLTDETNCPEYESEIFFYRERMSEVIRNILIVLLYPLKKEKLMLL